MTSQNTLIDLRRNEDRLAALGVRLHVLLIADGVSQIVPSTLAYLMRMFPHSETWAQIRCIREWRKTQPDLGRGSVVMQNCRARRAPSSVAPIEGLDRKEEDRFRPELVPVCVGEVNGVPYYLRVTLLVKTKNMQKHNGHVSNQALVDFFCFSLSICLLRTG